MLSTIALAAGTAVAAHGYGVSYGPGVGGFNDFALHRGAQVGSTSNYWRPEAPSALSSQHYQFEQKVASGCSTGYRGSNCEERTCPYGLSSNTSPYVQSGVSTAEHQADDLYSPTSRMSECVLVDGVCDESIFRGDPDDFLGTHTYIECSGQGICDHDTGQCECFDGYTGLGCRYTTCPNDCSGHGMCQQNARANPDYDSPDSYLFFGSQYWDAYKTMRCVCDRGYSGYDCSNRICPHGDDVLTTCLADAKSDVQHIDLEFANDISTFSEQSKYFTLTFVDAYNGVYNTYPIPVMDTVKATAFMTQTALESLPNFAIPSVQVSGTSTSSSQSLAITFSDANTPGLQKDLVCNTRAESEVCESGQQPYIESDLNDGDFICEMSSHDTLDPAMFEENIECGNRGICDRDTGQCNCFEGHTGEACETLSIYV